jgi:hypothetical protein
MRSASLSGALGAAPSMGFATDAVAGVAPGRIAGAQANATDLDIAGVDPASPPCRALAVSAAGESGHAPMKAPGGDAGKLNLLGRTTPLGY